MLVSQAQLYVQLRKRHPTDRFERRVLNEVINNGIRGKTFERYKAKEVCLVKAAFRMYQTQSSEQNAKKPNEQVLRRGDILPCILQTYISHGNPQWTLHEVMRHVSKQFPQYTFIRISLSSLMAFYHRKHPYFRRVSKGVYTLRDEYAKQFATVRTEALHPTRPPGRHATFDKHRFVEADTTPPFA